MEFVGMAAVEFAPSSSPITVDDVIAFAERHANDDTLATIAEKRPFIIEPTEGGVQIAIPTGSRFNVNRELIRWYLRVFRLARPDVRRKPSIYPRRWRERSYMARVLLEIQNERAAESVESEEARLNAEKPTVRKALLLARIGQGRFRDDLLALRKCCYVTGVSDPRFLRASHIKAWSTSSNVERLDEYNGLLLTPLYDHLFDRYLISFENNGGILVSRKIPEAIIASLGIDRSAVGVDLGARTKSYLRHHRAEFYRRVSSR